MSKKIIDLASGSITDSGLVYIGDPTTGTLNRLSYKQVKDYTTFGLPTASYNPINIHQFSSSILSYTSSNDTNIIILNAFRDFSVNTITDLWKFSGSMLNFTSSIQSQSNNIFSSQSNYTLTSSFNTLSSSLNTNINNVYASESKYTPTSSFNTFTSSLGKIYNVTSFGAKGDANDVLDAGMASNTTVSSATASFTPGDVGKACIMYGSGIAGANQTGTITGYISSTQVTVSFTAASTVTNKEFFYGTDSTAGIQAAINAVDAVKGGKVWLPCGVYFIGGSLVTSQSGSNPNCQIYIPYHAFIGQFEYQIDIEGEQTVNLNSGYFSSPNPTPTTGVILRSIISGTGTNPSVIGGGDPTHQVATAINFTKFTIQAYTNQGTAAPTLTGINSFNMFTVNGTKVGCAIDVPNQSSHNANGTETAGWIVSFDGNAGPHILRECSAMGYKYGFILNEHTILENTYVIACAYAYVIPTTNYAITGVCEYVACNNGLYFPTSSVMGITSGPGYVFDLKMISESDADPAFGSFWYDTFTSNINDPSNFGNGIVKTLSKVGGTIAVAPLTVIGGANLKATIYNNEAGKITNNFNSAYVGLEINNVNAGSAAASVIGVTNDSGSTKGMFIYSFGSGFTTFGHGASLLNQDSGILLIGTNNAYAMYIAANGSISLNGTTSPAASAKMDIVSTTQGFLPPRMTTTQKNAISSPAEGLVVYDTTLHKLCLYNGSIWQSGSFT